MQFFDRFMNLAKADAHGVLDSLEDPGLVLKQCLRSAESELTANQSRRDELSRWLDALARQHETLAERAGELDEEIQLGIAEESEDLARFSIRRLLATQRKGEKIAGEIRVAEEERDALVARTAAQEAELADLQVAVEAHFSRERAAENGCAAAGAEHDIGSGIRDEEVELELLRRRRIANDGEALR